MYVQLYVNRHPELLSRVAHHIPGEQQVPLRRVAESGLYYIILIIVYDMYCIMS